MIRRHKLTEEDSEKIAEGIKQSSSRKHGHSSPESGEKPEGPISVDSESPENEAPTAETEKPEEAETIEYEKEFFYPEDDEENGSALPSEAEELPSPSFEGTEEESDNTETEAEVPEKADVPAEAKPSEARETPKKELEALTCELPGSKEAKEPEERTDESDDEYVARQFVDSLRTLKGKKRRTLKKRRRSLIRTLLLILFIALFLLSVYMILKDVIAGYQAKSIYSRLQNEFFDGIVSSNNTASPCLPMKIDTVTPPYGEQRIKVDLSDNIVRKSNAQFRQFQAKLASLKIENPDTVGWMTVDGTNINYVVVQGDDNEYYLDHTFTGLYNPLGAIFMDYRDNENMLENYNTVIYGHNAAYLNQMFNQLSNLLDRETFENNRYITVYTTYGILIYETFSLYETDVSFNYYAVNFYSPYGFISWANAIKNNSVYQRDGMTPFTETDRILTLSTCTNGPSTRRYVVHARLVAIEGD